MGLAVVAGAQQLHADEDASSRAPKQGSREQQKSRQADRTNDHVGNRRVVHGLFDDPNDDRLGSALEQRHRPIFSIGRPAGLGLRSRCSERRALGGDRVHLLQSSADT